MPNVLLVFSSIFACTTTSKESDTSSTLVEPNDKGTIRFLALGDAGEGNQAQYDVATAMKNICDQKGCDFVLYLGDNFYDVGVESIEDPQFVSKFEEPYANIDIPFYAVLGNHDYAGGHIWEKPDPQIAYSDISEKWNMPDRYYSFTKEHALFLGLDTNAILWNNAWGGMEEQGEWFQNALSQSDSLWHFAFGHHPYISNGQHGVAGMYDGLEEVPIASGADMKFFVEEHLCGKIDIYFSGHDHDMQWLEPQCGVEFIVSGAGAKQRDRYGWDVPTQFERYNDNGFLWVEIVDRTLNATFYDKTGAILYQQSVQK